MKQFAVVLYFAVVAVAAAQSGYNYRGPVRHSQPIGNLRPQTPNSNSGIYSVVQSPPLAQFNVQSQHPLPAPAPALAPAPSYAPQPAPLPAPVPQQNYAPAPQPIQHTIPAPQPQYAPQPISYQQPQQQIVQTYQQPQQEVYQQPQQQYVQNVQRPAIITKDIYIHSAPEDTEELNIAPQLDNVPVRKNYRIVFIKAPTQNLRHTAHALKQAQSSNEEKTVIYVLSKKPDLNEIQQQLQLGQPEQKVHKPEVYFIKYKTQEEAARAQQEIQAQYDALGGATHISDEGIAPITSVSGGSLNLGALIGGGIAQNGQQQSFGQQGFQSQSLGLGGSSVSFGAAQPPSRYLPAKTKK